MELLKKFNDYFEAQIVCGYLKANDIDAELFDTNMMTVIPHLGLTLGDFRLVVPKRQLFQAQQLLAAKSNSKNENESFLAENGHAVPQVACPKCGHQDYVVKKPVIARALSWWWIGMPFFARSRKVCCNKCGTKIPDEIQ